MKRTLSLFVSTMLALMSAMSAPGPAKAQDANDPITALLTARAAAVRSADRKAFEATMSLAPEAFKERQRTWLDRIRILPLETYELVRIDDEYGDLARPKDAQGFDEARVLQIDERIGIRGFDTRPQAEDVYLTIARKGATWSIVGDTAVEDIGLLSMRNIWDYGSIETRQESGIMVVYHPSERGAVGTILAQSRQARSRIRRDWPFPWTDPIIIMVPSTVEELARILQTTFALTSFVAFAGSSVERDTGKGYILSGHRVFLHWPNFRGYQSNFQTSILAHEFLHLATRDIAGPFTTAIFDEGVAQHYGEGGGETEQLRRRVRAKTLPRTLVPDWFFTAGPRNDIFLSYEEGASFIRYLTRRFGAKAGAEAYRALGVIDPASPGTWRYHLDRVTQSLFRQSFASLERGWYESVTKELS